MALILSLVVQNCALSTEDLLSCTRVNQHLYRLLESREGESRWCLSANQGLDTSSFFPSNWKRVAINLSRGCSLFRLAYLGYYPLVDASLDASRERVLRDMESHRYYLPGPCYCYEEESLRFWCDHCQDIMTVVAGILVSDCPDDAEEYLKRLGVKDYSMSIDYVMVASLLEEPLSPKVQLKFLRRYLECRSRFSGEDDKVDNESRERLANALIEASEEVREIAMATYGFTEMELITTTDWVSKSLEIFKKWLPLCLESGSDNNSRLLVKVLGTQEAEKVRAYLALKTFPKVSAGKIITEDVFMYLIRCLRSEKPELINVLINNPVLGLESPHYNFYDELSYRETFNYIEAVRERKVLGIIAASPHFKVSSGSMAVLQTGFPVYHNIFLQALRPLAPNEQRLLLMFALEHDFRFDSTPLKEGLIDLQADGAEACYKAVALNRLGALQWLLKQMSQRKIKIPTRELLEAAVRKDSKSLILCVAKQTKANVQAEDSYLYRLALQLKLSKGVLNVLSPK